MAKKHNKFYTGHLDKGKKGKQWLEELEEKFWDGYRLVQFHPLFAPLIGHITVYRYLDEQNLCPRDGWLVVTNNGDIHVHPYRMAEPEEWAYLLAHPLLHLGLAHFVQQGDALRWNVACDRVAACFLQEFKFGKRPEQMTAIDVGTRDENKLYQQILQDNLSESLQQYGTAGLWECDMLFEPERLDSYGKPTDWQRLFSIGLQNAVSEAVHNVSGQSNRPKLSEAEQVKRWFMNNFPLLGALAVAFEVIEDPKICYQMNISVAAVDAEAGKIYFNPQAFSIYEGREAEYRFVMAHELLHVALRHHARRQGRDPFLWNVACDYVINAWLIEMNVGMMPKMGLLYDPELKGMNAEAVYDKIVNDLRMYRKRPSLQSKLEREFTTFRGKGGCDIIDGSHPTWWSTGDGLGLDEFYRRCLAQGLHYHEAQGRGFIPAGLMEEIMAIGRPPIPWDVELAQWFDVHFPPLEERRSYARPSRRQSSTPDIPRPRYIKEEVDEKSRTFGVILDTSGSMSRELLAKALGSIANYAIARDVTMVRVVFCDAHPYDQNYMPPEAIAGRVKVVGRGGTVLMPAVHLLERAVDFPPTAPILIITDTECDRIHVQKPRDHAFLIPHGKHLPFPSYAPVFRVE